ncbi:hypothetical protein A5M85_16915 [Cellulophaga lytica]|uniref:hypothetical protein n=1 Tax=Cellulophaga lytica TaxID=979 RepID=UPI0009504C6C|nr:hypothetical protein [Cellulophaga lytica]APU11900.1 hypothetical protein A5M85_16915 [Cellulophaga lytica]
MRFPLLNISERKWCSKKNKDYIIYDKFIYTNNETIYNEIYKNNLFIDCNGKIYSVLKKAELIEKWRIWLRFIPNIYKKEIIFKPTGESWTAEELRKYLIERVSELNTNEHTRSWITYLKKAKNYEELIGL